MKIISIANQKGGCAKTTTTCNLGACLGKLGNKVLLIDNDPQGNLTSSIGVKEYKNTIYDLLVKNVPIEEVIINTGFENIDVIPASLDYSNFELEMAAVEGREYLLKGVIDNTNLQYDYILIDCSPSLSLTVVNALVASDSILIPLEASIFNLQGLGQLIKILKLIQANYNAGLKVEGVLLTRVDSRTTLTGSFKEELQGIFGNKLFNTLIHQNTAIVRSQIQNEPVIYFDKSSKGAKEYMELAKEVLSNG